MATPRVLHSPAAVGQRSVVVQRSLHGSPTTNEEHRTCPNASDPIPGTVPGAADDVGGADSISASNIANTSMKHNYYAGYFQDDFKVTSKLTLNLGLRYAYFGQLIENYGDQSNFLLPGQMGISTFLLTQRRCNTPFSPDFETAVAKDGIDIVCSGQPGLGVSQKRNSRRDSASPINSLPSSWCAVDTGSSSAVRNFRSRNLRGLSLPIHAELQLSSAEFAD